MDLEKLAVSIMTEICETDEIIEEPDMDLFEAGLIDSLASINIILAIEDNLNIQLQPTDLDRKDISTLNNFKVFLVKIGSEKNDSV